MADRQFTPAPKTALDNTKLALSGKPWKEGDFKTIPKLQPRYVKGNIWLTCYANNPNEDTREAINVKMDPHIAMTFFNIIQDAIDNPDNFTMRGVENRGYVYSAGNKRSDKPLMVSSAYVGINGEGEICIIVKAYKREPVRIVFTTNYWFNLIDKSGEPLEKSLISRYVAQGWLDAIRPIIGNLVTDNYVHPEPRQQGGGQRQAPTKANNPGGAAASSNPFDDDLDF